MISATNAGSAVACREVLAAWHDLREGAREEGEAVYGLELAHHLVPFRSTKYEDLEDNAILKVNPRRGGAEWHWVVWDAKRRRLLDPRDPPYKRISACSYLRVR